MSLSRGCRHALQWAVMVLSLSWVLPGNAQTAIGVGFVAPGPTPSSPQSLVVDPNDAAVLYAVPAYYGAFKSGDGGASWSLATPGPVSAIAVAPSNSQVLYAFASGSMDGGALWWGFGREGLYAIVVRSDDGGVSWRLMSQPGQLYLGALAVDPINANVVYLGTDRGLLKSTNGGLSWAMLPGAAVTGGGSSSGGGSSTGYVLPISAVAVERSNPAVIYLAAQNGVYKSVNGGSTWTPLTASLGTTVYALALDPSVPGTVYVGTDSGVMWIAADGLSMLPIAAGVPAGRVNALALAGGATPRLYIGRENDTNLYSYMGGALGAFQFTAQRGAGRAVPVVSNSLTVLGATASEVISITGGEYSVNDAAYTAAPGVAQAGDRVSVRVMSALALDTTVTATLSLGTLQGTFAVTTRTTNAAPTLNLSDAWFAPIPEGTALGFTFGSVDPDGDATRYSASGLPAGASFVDNGDGTATFVWTTMRGDAGVYPLTFTVSDGIASHSDARVLTVLASTSHPVLSFPFDEGSGTTTLDDSPTSLKGALVRAAWQSGLAGNSVRLSGNGFVRVLDHPALDLTGAFTLQAWVKPTAKMQTAAFLAKNNGVDTTLPYLFGIYEGKVYAIVEKVTHSSRAELATDVWSHVAVTWDTQAVRIFVNGEQVYWGAHSIAPTANTNRLLVGARNSGTSYTAGFVGQMDEVQIWSSLRRADHICVDAGRIWNGVSCTGMAFANSAPAALNGMLAVDAGGVASGVLPASDHNADALTFVLVQPPARGTVTITDASTGAYTYTASSIPNQTDSFTFQVLDPFARSNTASVAVTIGAYAETDTDGDGMPDGFEVAYGLNPASSADAGLDADRDDVSNYDEFLATRDPTIGAETDPLHVLGMSFSEGVGTAPSRDATTYQQLGSLRKTAWVAGKQGFGLRFTGSSVVAVPDSAALDINDPMTLEMWVKPSSSGQSSFFAAKNVDLPTEFAYGLGLVSGALRAQFGNNRYLSSYTVPVNVWTHVAVVWDGAKVRLYANGQEVYRASRTAAMITNNQPLILGARSKIGGIAQGFRGDLDQVNIWTRARSAGELCAASDGVLTAGSCVH